MDKVPFLIFAAILFGFIFGIAVGMLVLPRNQRMTRFLDDRVRPPLILQASEVELAGKEASSVYAPALRRIIGFLRSPRLTKIPEYIRPRLAVAGIDKSAEQWLAEQILFTLGLAAGLFALTKLAQTQKIAVPDGIFVMAIAIPILAIVNIRTKMMNRRNLVKAELPHVLIIMAAIARVAQSFEAPGGVLPTTVKLLDGEASALLYDVMLEASVNNMEVEDVMDQFAVFWGLPYLERLATAVRLARVHGVGLADAMSNTASKIAEDLEEEVTSAASSATITGVIPIVLCDLPGGLMLLLYPAAAQVITALTTGGTG